jgi:putative transposase
LEARNLIAGIRNNLTTSMSRRGNRYDDAVTESFFSNLKKGKLKYFFNKKQAVKPVFDFK